MSDLGLSGIGARLHEAGKLEEPKVLYEGWRAGEIDVEWLAELIPPTWRYSEAPAPIGEAGWLELFDAVPTPLIEDAEHDVPDFVTKLWRGCHPGAERGFSWTYDPERAGLFAGRDEEGRIFEIPYDRSIVLGVFGYEVSTEHEVVVDPRLLHGQFEPRLTDDEL